MSSKGAEIARRYRERRDADPDRRRKYLEKERDKWKKDRETGTKKGVNELSERAKRAKRKKWREAKSQDRARDRASALLQSETPPDSPAAPENQPEPGLSGQQRLGASARRRSKRKLKDQIEILEAQLAKEKTKTEKYKKRLLGPRKEVRLNHHVQKSMLCWDVKK
ncbi:Vezatin [Dissostichus eleginoides]|uniref:Vezatin n=1 Tax=Dissostichus eleginoides TaxID=100907 RepID=A0AAD9BWP7_DISEL|nr:Vezatin [Dissostichus eleginoides]